MEWGDLLVRNRKRKKKLCHLTLLNEVSDQCVESSSYEEKKRKTVPLQKMKEMEFGTAQPEKS